MIITGCLQRALYAAAECTACIPGILGFWLPLRSNSRWESVFKSLAKLRNLCSSPRNDSLPMSSEPRSTPSKASYFQALADAFGFDYDTYDLLPMTSLPYVFQSLESLGHEHAFIYYLSGQDDNESSSNEFHGSLTFDRVNVCSRMSLTKKRLYNNGLFKSRDFPNAALNALNSATSLFYPKKLAQIPFPGFIFPTS